MNCKKSKADTEAGMSMDTRIAFSKPPQLAKANETELLAGPLLSSKSWQRSCNH